MVVNSDDVAEELVKKLRAAGFDINPEIVTCADLITLLGACQIHSPLRVVEGSTRPGLERYRGQANRFAAFNPEERQIMLALLESHLNAVSSIGLTTEVRVAGYLAKLEALEAECKL